MAGDDSYSIVIVTYDHADSIPACLEAVGRLDPAPVRVIVIDNDSGDGTADAVAAYASHLELELIREECNTGFAAAANRGITAARTPWVLLLNPDCAPRSDMVGRLFKALSKVREPSRVAVLTPKLLRAAGPDLKATPVLDAAGMMVTCSGRHFDRGAGAPDDGGGDRPAWVFGGTGAAALYRRQALDDVAYPDGQFFAETFFAYREDAELAWRLQLRDWRCLYVPDAVGSHERGFRPERGRRGHADINRYSVRNRFLLRAHCADLGWHLRCLPWWFARDLLVVGACLTVERGSLPGLLEAWRLRSDALEKRRWVLGRRTVSGQRMGRWFRKKGWVEKMEPS